MPPASTKILEKSRMQALLGWLASRAKKRLKGFKLLAYVTVRLIYFGKERKNLIPAHERNGCPTKQMSKREKFTQDFYEVRSKHRRTRNGGTGHLDQQFLVPRVGSRHIPIPLASNQFKNLLDLGV